MALKRTYISNPIKTAIIQTITQVKKYMNPKCKKVT